MRLIPRSFFWRTILLILVPLVVAQVIIANVFFGNHWARVHATLARTLAGEVTTRMNFMDGGNIGAAQTMANDIGINFSIHDKLNRPKYNRAVLNARLIYTLTAHRVLFILIFQRKTAKSQHSGQVFIVFIRPVPKFL